MVRGWRVGMGYSQEQLAERAGLHRTYIADIERGARNPSLASINKLAEALQLSLSTLFSTTDAPNANTPAIAGDEESRVVDILLVEDRDEDIALTLRAFKKAHLSNRVHVVRDGEEALSFIFARGTYADRESLSRPKVILLDLNLPKVDGREVLRLIKRDESMKSIPVVILTCSEFSDDIEECTRLGANAYIVKPVDFLRLAEITPQLNCSWKLYSY